MIVGILHDTWNVSREREQKDSFYYSLFHLGPRKPSNWCYKVSSLFSTSTSRSSHERVNLGYQASQMSNGVIYQSSIEFKFY